MEMSAKSTFGPQGQILLSPYHRPKQLLTWYGQFQQNLFCQLAT